MEVLIGFFSTSMITWLTAYNSSPWYMDIYQPLFGEFYQPRQPIAQSAFYSWVVSFSFSFSKFFKLIIIYAYDYSNNFMANIKAKKSSQSSLYSQRPPPIGILKILQVIRQAGVNNTFNHGKPWWWTGKTIYYFVPAVISLTNLISIHILNKNLFYFNFFL